MARTVVALSGSIASGKSTLARGLQRRYEIRHVRTQHLLRDRAKQSGRGDLNERRALQNYGELLDRETGGRWVAEDLAPMLARMPDRTVVVIDAVRLSTQLDGLREVFGRRLSHVHLQAPVEVLSHRYLSRDSELTELASYAETKQDPTEAAVDSLARLADIVIDTAQNRVEDVETRCAARLGLLPPLGEPLVDAIIGGQYGSEGKGNIAYYLAPEYDVLVRVGGPNAGHKVPDFDEHGSSYTHRSLPSGTRANETATLIIGPGAVINPTVLLKEISECAVEAGRLYIDPQVMVIKEQDIEAERQLVKAIGSTGQGVGHATARRILEREGSGATLAKDVPELRPFMPKHGAGAILEEAFSRGQRVLLEGTQGTGLSLFHGSYPHVTSRDTTVAGTLAEAGISPRRVRRVVMVCRTYPIRVGGPSGPLSTELDWTDIATRSSLSALDLENTEKGSVSGNQRRVSEFDWALLRRSAELNGASDIALTFADYIDVRNRAAFRFDQLSSATLRFIEEVEQVAGCSVSLVAARFTARSVLDRRNWRGHLTDRHRE